jgi:hypothetical protein
MCIDGILGDPALWLALRSFFISCVTNAQVLLAAGEEARASGQYHLVVSSGSTTDIMSSVREELSAHVPEVVPAPFR